MRRKKSSRINFDVHFFASSTRCDIFYKFINQDRFGKTIFDHSCSCKNIEHLLDCRHPENESILKKEKERAKK